LEKGLQVNFGKLVPEELQNKILEAINQCGCEKLKPIKEALPEEVTYGAIKFMIYKCQMEMT